jgi:uncharacterized protein (TIRG00374 family)
MPDADIKATGGEVGQIPAGSAPLSRWSIFLTVAGMIALGEYLARLASTPSPPAHRRLRRPGSVHLRPDRLAHRRPGLIDGLLGHLFIGQARLPWLGLIGGLCLAAGLFAIFRQLRRESRSQVARLGGDRFIRPRVHRTGWRRWLRIAGLVGIVAAIAYAVHAESADVEAATDLLGRMRLQPLVMAAYFEAVSMVAAARMQSWLLRSGGVRLPLRQLVQVNLAGNALSVTLPGGAAFSAAFTFDQLRRRGARFVLAGWVLTVAGLLSFITLGGLATTGILAANDPLSRSLHVLAAIGLVIEALLVLAICLAGPTLASRLITGLGRRLANRPAGRLQRLSQPLTSIGRQAMLVRPGSRVWAMSWLEAIVNWVGDALCLLGALRAVHAHIGWAEVLVAYCLTQLAATIPITPGGLGIVEGSLTFSLVRFHLTAATALAAVVVYRILSLILPAIIGWGMIGWLAWRSRFLPPGLSDLEPAAREQPSPTLASPAEPSQPVQAN